MRCHICDNLINRPVYNRELKSWEPCTVCLEVINNVFEDPVVEDVYADEDTEPVNDNEIEKLLDNHPQ